MSVRAACLSSLVLGACSREHAPAPAPPPPVLGSPVLAVVGQHCLDCHAETVRSYRETGMARAIEPVRPLELSGLARVADADTGWSYGFEQDSKGQSIVEIWKGDEKAIRADLPFAIGAGLMDRSYAAVVGDLMWFAPLEVVGQGARRRAAMAPGHTIRPGSRFTVPIAEECLACHTDRLPARDFPLNLRPHSGSWQPSGISCAVCHGDVEGHAQWREMDLAGGKLDDGDPVLTASRAGWVQSLSLCARCHLQGDASFLLEAGARGVLAPGEDMLAKRAVFVADTPTDEIGFVSQVERLVLSRCFSEPAKAGREPPTCLSCHDPHRSSFDGKERAVVREGCLKCHTSSGMTCALPVEKRQGRDCVDCHMPRTGVFDVAGVEIHDHFIRRSPGPPSSPSQSTTLRVKESKDGRLALFAWPGREKPPYAEDPGLWMMAEIACGRADLALPFAEREPGPASTNLATYHHLRGSLLEASSRSGDTRADARAAYERALALDPGQTETAVNLGLLLGGLGKPRDGIAVLDAAITEHPKAATALRNRAVLRLQLGDRDGFAADLAAAFAISPDAALASALAEHYRKLGRGKDVDHWAHSARSLDPSRSPRAIPPR